LLEEGGTIYIDMTLGQVKEAALRLLKYMSEHQAEWKEGAEVHPAEAGSS
jgi:hypothetical protein